MKTKWQKNGALPADDKGKSHARIVMSKIEVCKRPDIEE